MIHLNDQEFKVLCDYMQKNYGINLSKKRVLIECRLSQVLEEHKIDSFQEYIKQIFSDKTGEYVKELLNSLTTNYTFFMREPAHFNYLTEHILPEVSTKKAKQYQIWCAGCSSGQECYTLAMVLEEYQNSGKTLPQVKIVATDISSKVLDQAREGRYPLKDLNQIPELWRKRYCNINQEKNYFEIKKGLKKNISFQQQNLMERKYKRKEFDLIFCRNVMIYFDDQARRRIISHLFDALKDDGYLFIGHTEMIPYNSPLFAFINSSVYRKKGIVHE